MMITMEKHFDISRVQSEYDGIYSIKNCSVIFLFILFLVINFFLSQM